MSSSIDLDNPPDVARPYVELYKLREAQNLDTLNCLSAARSALATTIAERNGARAIVEVVTAERDAAIRGRDEINGLTELYEITVVLPEGLTTYPPSDQLVASARLASILVRYPNAFVSKPSAHREHDGVMTLRYQVTVESPLNLDALRGW